MPVKTTKLLIPVIFVVVIHSKKKKNISEMHGSTGFRLQQEKGKLTINYNYMLTLQINSETLAAGVTVI